MQVDNLERETCFQNYSKIEFDLNTFFFCVNRGILTQTQTCFLGVLETGFNSYK